MLEKKKVTITAETCLSFMEQFGEYSKKGYVIADPVGFDLNLFMSIQTNYWKADLVLDIQKYIDIGIDNLAWEDICILADTLGVKYTSKKVMQKDIKTALELK